MPELFVTSVVNSLLIYISCVFIQPLSIDILLIILYPGILNLYYDKWSWQINLVVGMYIVVDYIDVAESDVKW